MLNEVIPCHIMAYVMSCHVMQLKKGSEVKSCQIKLNDIV